MSLKNNGQLAGNLVEDPKMFNSSSGAMATFTIAVRNSFKNSNGEYESRFIPITVFAPLAEVVVKYFAKGKGIQLSYTLKRRKTVDRGENRYLTELHVDKIDFANGLNINSGMICGFLTEDPNPFSSTKGDGVNIIVRVPNDYKNKDGKYGSEFIPISLYGKRAEFVNKYMQKGSGIIIHFSIGRKKTVDRGENRYINTLYVDKVEFGERLKNKDDYESADATPAEPIVPPSGFVGFSSGSNTDDFTVVDDDEDLPF